MPAVLIDPQHQLLSQSRGLAAVGVVLLDKPDRRRGGTVNVGFSELADFGDAGVKCGSLRINCVWRHGVIVWAQASGA